jgi:hypothetical protein
MRTLAYVNFLRTKTRFDVIQAARCVALRWLFLWCIVFNSLVALKCS